MELTYFGHSAFKLETERCMILVDPWLADNQFTDVDPETLNPDVIAVTHAHFDHFGDTPSIATRTDALVICNQEITSHLERYHGHDNVHSLNAGSGAEFDWGTVEAVYARHTSSFNDGSYGGTPSGYVFQIQGTTIYNTGDTASFPEMSRIGTEYDVDIALMPIGGSYTQGIEKAVDSVKMIDPSMTIPLHYDTFPQIEVDVKKWCNKMAESGFRTSVLGFGETMKI